MRDENCLLKRQRDGEEVDLDTLVEALADARDYQPHMYRPAVRTLAKEVRQLPLKVSEYVRYFLTSCCY